MKLQIVFFGLVLWGGVFGELLELNLPFSDVIICAPFNVLIRPSADPDKPYLTTIDAAQQVLDAIDLEYVEEVLKISTRASFDSPGAIRVILELPYDKLRSVSVQLKVNVAILGSFVVPNLLLSNVDDGIMYVSETQVEDVLTVRAGKRGFVIFDGKVNIADLNLQRSAHVYISTLDGDVQYQGSGRTQVFLNPTKEELVIEGNAASLAKVNVAGSFCNKVCTVQGTSRFRSPCKCIKEVTLPEIDLMYACGLSVVGASKCVDNTITAQTSVQIQGSFARSIAGSGSAVSSIVIVYTDCTTDMDQLRMQ